MRGSIAIHAVASGGYLKASAAAVLDASDRKGSLRTGGEGTGESWQLLLAQLNKIRGMQTRFFSFVDTVSARNFAGTNDPHGWVGLRFQSQPGAPSNDVLLHINMRDPSNVLEQEAIATCPARRSAVCNLRWVSASSRKKIEREKK
jgi:hypothetical protein